jgi:hypothetical protein
MRHIPEIEDNLYDISKKCVCEFHGNKQWIKQNSLNISATVWNKLIRRDFITVNSLYFIPRLIHEDYHWIFMASKKIQAMAFTNEICYIRYFVEGSTMTNPNKYPSLESYLRIADEMISNIDLTVLSHQINCVLGLLNDGINKINSSDKYKDLMPKYRARLQIVNPYRWGKMAVKLYIKKIVKKIFGKKIIGKIKLLRRKKNGT